MKIIALRGLPGSGKGFISKKLAERINCENIIEIDDFKLEFSKQNPKVSFSEGLEHSYEKALDQVYKFYKNKAKIIIIEEIFNDIDFVKKLNHFCVKNGVKIDWFYIKRDLEKLLETEKSRDRKIKNTKENLLELQKEIESIKIENETVIENKKNIDKILKQILEKI